VRHTGGTRGALQIPLAAVDGAIAATELEQTLLGDVAALLVLLTVVLSLAPCPDEAGVRRALVTPTGRKEHRDEPEGGNAPVGHRQVE
jgi:hypothetical protein